MHPFLKDVILTSGTWVVVSIESLVAISLLGHLMGPQAVAEYLLVRRVAAWLLTATLLGLGVGLPRYVAFAKPSSRDRQMYFWAAMACGVGVSLILLLVLNLEPQLSAKWLLGKTEFHYLVFPLSLLLLAQAVNTIVFGYYRGCMRMNLANTLSFLNFALIPLLPIIIFWRRNSIPLITTATAVPMIAISVLLAWPVLLRLPSDARNVFSKTRELLHYGAPRVPGDVAMGALLSLPPMIAAHYFALPQVASMLLGIGVLTLVGTGVNPLNQVLLAKISMVLSRNRWEEARRYVEYLSAAVLDISIFTCLQLVVFADVIVRLWVGPKFLDQMLLIRILLAAIPFYLFFTALRSAIDAASVKPLNARNVLIALAVFAALVGAAVTVAPRAWLLDLIGASLLGALIAVAAFTARTLHDVYRVHFQWSRSFYALLLGAALGAISGGIRWAEGFRTSAVTLAVTELIMIALFFGVLKKADTQWLEFVSTTLLRHRRVGVETVLTNSTVSSRG